MVFKERTFFGETPHDERIETPASGSAVLEARVADCLAALPDIDASEVTVVADGGRIVLGGFMGTAEEIERAMAATLTITGVEAVSSAISTR